MALVLPSSVDYKQSLPALPDAAVQIPVAASPVNGTSFSAGQQIQFDLLNRGFLVPDSMYLSYSWVATKAAAGVADDTFFRATPVYTSFNRLDIQIGSQTVDTIQSYGLVMHLLVNTQLDIAQKYGLQSAYGYGKNNGATAALLEDLDGRGLAAATSTAGSFSAPLVSMLSNSEKLLPLFAMPQVRVTLTMDSLSNIFGGVGATGYTISNVELRYKVVDMGGAVENIVLGMGDKLYIKSQSFSCASQTIPASTTGYNELVFNQRFASVKSLYAINGCGGAAAVNNFYDSSDITNNGGDYSFSIGGVISPSKPISTVTAKSQALMELKSAAGSIYDKSNNMSINSIEFAYTGANPTTTFTAPAKFFVGTSVERLNSDSLLTGVSTQNSPISYRINGVAVGAASSIVSLVVNYDALIEVDTMTRQASVKA